MNGPQELAGVRRLMEGREMSEQEKDARVEAWCLWCDKARHKTDECHSTHGLNTPAARELQRLTNAAFAAADAAGGVKPGLMTGGDTERPERVSPAYAQCKAVNNVALQMVRNALRNDAERGLTVRAEMLAELDRATFDMPQAGADAAQASAEGEASVSLSPIARRRVLEAIEGAYSLGHSDAKAGSWAASEVRDDHGGALIAALERAIYTHPAPAPAVPEGMRLVPVEPTQAMKKAAKKVDMDHGSFREWVEEDWPDHKRVWAAMLAAAPEAPAPAGKESSNG